MRKSLSFLLVMVLCAAVFVPVFAEEQKADDNTKADFGFFLSGGSYKGKTSWMGEFYLAQNWHISKATGFFFQATGMAYIYDSKRPWENGEYGASAGLGFELYPWENGRIGAYVFVDALGKNRFWFAQYRPTILIAGSRLKLMGGIALHLTKPLIIGTEVSDPIFWQDEVAYYYDVRTTRQIVENIDYWFVRGEMIWPLDFVKFFGEYTQGLDKYKNIQRTQLGAEVKIFNWLSGEVEWFQTRGSENIWTQWFSQNGLRYAIHLDPFAAISKFADFLQRKFVEVLWPIVVTHGEEQVQTTEIAKVIKVELKTDKNKYCDTETVEAIGTVLTGTLPLTGYFDFGDGTIISTEIPGLNQPISAYHKYAQAGEYCIKFTVKDKWGHEDTQCVCITIEKCKNDDCPEARVIRLTADKHLIKLGEEVTITGETRNALRAFLDNGVEFKNKPEPPNALFTETFKPTKTTTITLKAENDCPSRNSISITIMVDECKEIIVKDTDLQIFPSSVKVGEEVTVDLFMAQYATNAQLYKDGVLVATDPGNYKYTFTTPGTHTFTAKWSNECDNQELSKTVTVTCDKCGDTEIKEGGSDTYPIPNIPAGNYKKTITVTNSGDCDWSNFLVRAKMEKQSGGALLARNEFTFNLPAKSQVKIDVFYNDSSKTISFTIVSTTPLTQGLIPILQCEYYKMTIATECGASF